MTNSRMLVNEDILLGVNKESCNDQLRLDKKKKNSGNKQAAIINCTNLLLIMDLVIVISHITDYAAQKLFPKGKPCHHAL
jgi:hypothetical protein